MTMSEQITILRTRIHDFKERIEELSVQRNLSHSDAWLLLSLQAQVQEDHTKLRAATGELL